MTEPTKIAVENASSNDANLFRCKLGFALLLTLLLTLIAGKAVMYDTLDPDAFWHLRVADQLENEGVHPLVDQLSFASDKRPWTPYSWLAELGMKRVWELGGFRAAVATQALVIGAMFFMLAITCVEKCKPPRPYIAIALATMFAAYLALPYLSFRPVTLSCAILATCGWLIARDRRLEERTGSVWLVPILTAININVHLFALFAPLWMAALVVGAVYERSRITHWSERSDYSRRVRRNLILFGACLLACAVTPMLPGLIKTAAHYGQSDPMIAAGQIAELRPFYRDKMWPLTAVILVAALGAIVARRKQVRVAEWIMLAIGVVALFRMGRLAPLFVIVGAPMLAASLPMLRGQLLARPLVLTALAIVVSLALFRVAWDFPSRQTTLAQWLNRHGPDTPGYPTGAADFIAKNVPPAHGRIINDFSWGGYLAWELGPQFQVFMDPRTQVYSAAFWQRTCLGDQQMMIETIRPIRADAAIVPLTSKRLVVALDQLGWRRVYEDERAAVLVPPGSTIADTRD